MNKPVLSSDRKHPDRKHPDRKHPETTTAQDHVFSRLFSQFAHTATTIITFLMVFLIQNTQNRDTLALQVKLAELIIAMKGAENRIAAVEELSEEDLEKLHKDLAARAQATSDVLNVRRSKKKEAP
jgi:low affinity Fe/Cu permease